MRDADKKRGAARGRSLSGTSGATPKRAKPWLSEPLDILSGEYSDASSTGYDEAMQKSLSEQDRLELEKAMQDVRRLKNSARYLAPNNPPSPRPRSREADERLVLEELQYAPLDPDPVEAADAISYRGPGLQDSAWRRLRRGSYRINDELDLHGLNRERARIAVHLFIEDCRTRGIRCVRIIHGKGLRSPNTGPVIKSLLDSWLRRRKDVLAFCSAKAHDGGTGAIYVLLKASRAA